MNTGVQRFVVLIGVALLSMSSSACSDLSHVLGRSEELRLVLPQVPAEFGLDRDQEAAVRYELRWVESGAGGSSTVIRGVGRSEIAVEVNRDTHSAFTVVLEPHPGVRLSAAGAVYPVHRDRSRGLPLRYEAGFLAALVQDLLLYDERSIDGLNLVRLDREIMNRSGGNPYQVDRTQLLRHLSGASMRANNIRLLETEPVSLCLPPGTWVSLNPLYGPTLSTTTEECAALFDIPAAMVAHWYSPDTRVLLSAHGDGAGGSEHMMISINDWDTEAIQD